MVKFPLLLKLALQTLSKTIIFIKTTSIFMTSFTGLPSRFRSSFTTSNHLFPSSLPLTFPRRQKIPSFPLLHQRCTSKEHRSQFEPLRLSQVSIANSAAKNHAFVAYSLLIPRVDVEEEEKSMSKQKTAEKTRGFCIYLQFNVAGFWLFHAALFSTLV
jgi:hypothetical protein